LEVDLKSPGSKFLLCSFWFLSFCVYAQETETGILASWLALDAPTGHEYLATDTIQQRYAGWQRDRYGNLIKEIGNGEPRRIVACGLDSYAYAVSQITDAGYLRLHRIGSGSRHPLWDQAHEGQQLRILTRGGPLLGVSAIANGHFASQHRGETAIVTQDDLWLDVGAESADEVLAMGIALLDPVLRNIPPWHYATEIAGPRAGARVGCAAVFAAAEAGINGTDGTTFAVYGAPNAGLSWPGRYSHSPVEIADLRDVVKLIDLIQAMAEAPLDTP
jgi:putative aminopeptidase FrvX